MSTVLVIIGIAIIVLLLIYIFRGDSDEQFYRGNPDNREHLTEEDEDFISSYYDEMRYKRKQIH